MRSGNMSMHIETQEPPVTTGPDASEVEDQSMSDENMSIISSSSGQPTTVATTQSVSPPHNFSHTSVDSSDSSRQPIQTGNHEIPIYDAPGNDRRGQGAFADAVSKNAKGIEQKARWRYAKLKQAPKRKNKGERRAREKQAKIDWRNRLEQRFDMYGIPNPKGECKFCKGKPLNCIVMPHKDGSMENGRIRCKACTIRGKPCITLDTADASPEPLPTACQDMAIPFCSDPSSDGNLKVFASLSRKQKTSMILGLIDTVGQRNSSGMFPPEGACTACQAGGSAESCRIIRPKSFAATLSKMKSCTNCFKAHKIRCSAARQDLSHLVVDEEVQICGSRNVKAATESFQTPIEVGQAPSTIDPKCMATPLEPDYAHEQVSKLSLSFGNLGNQASESSGSCFPLSIQGLENIKSWTAAKSRPNVLTAIQEILGVVGAKPLASRVSLFRLQETPLAEVICGVAAVVTKNIIFSTNPFFGLPGVNALVRATTDCSDSEKTVARKVEPHFIAMVNDDDFKSELDRQARGHATTIWQILEPLLTAGSAKNSYFVEVCQKECLVIARNACRLNAQLKARSFPLSVFIGTSGLGFDEKVFESECGAAHSTVAWPLGLGIRRDDKSNVDPILARALVETMN